MDHSCPLLSRALLCVILLENFKELPVFAWILLKGSLQPKLSKKVKKKLRNIFDNASEGICVINEKGIIESFNDAATKLFGYHVDEIIGQNVSVLAPSPHREEHDNYLAKYLETGKANIIGIGREVEAIRKNGELFPLHLSLSETIQGESRVFTGIMQDLTHIRKTEEEKKNVENQLQQAQKLESIGQLAGGVAHDFNNILAGILGYASMLKAQFKDDKKVYNKLNIIEKSAVRGAELTRGLLGFSRKREI